MIIELEREIEAQLIRKAQEEGKLPGEYAAELLRSSLNASETTHETGDGDYTDKDGWLRDSKGTLLGFDGLTWRQIAHLDHKY